VNRDRIAFLFLNLGHFFDHLLVLIFATVAALALAAEWNMSYGALIPYATPGFIAFGLFALPAGWIADKWSREGMMVIFFLGIGLSALMTALAQTPVQIGAGLLAIGVFAAIYHPVGLAMVVHGRTKTGMPLAVNGVFGNMGVAAAALLAGVLIDLAGWRAAFALPGAAAFLTGLAYAAFVWSGLEVRAEAKRSGAEQRKAATGTLAVDRTTVVRVLAIVFLSTGIGGLIFQSTTFALPKVFDERLTVLAGSASAVGWYAFLVFALAGPAGGGLPGGPPLGAQGLRRGGRLAGDLLRRDARAHRAAGPLRLHRLHAGGLRPDPHQRRAGGPGVEERVAQPHLRLPLRGDLYHHGLDHPPGRLATLHLGLRRALRGPGHRRHGHLPGGPAVAGVALDERGRTGGRGGRVGLRDKQGFTRGFAKPSA
jgi:MFS family permease